MKFSFKQLVYIQAAAEHRSIAKASDKLGISKSSIVAALNGFEEQFSVNIFIRQASKGLTPTPVGKKFIEGIEQLLQHAQTFDDAFSGHFESLSGELVIGCFAPLAPHVLPSIIRSLNLKFPQLTIRVIEGDLRFVSALLNNGAADVVLSYDLGLPEGIEFEKLGEAPPYAVFSSSDTFASRESVSIQELAGRAMILLDIPESRTYFDLIFKTANITPKIAFRTGTYETLRGFVAAGLGYSILNLRPAIDHTYNGNKVVCVPISTMLPTPAIGIHTRPSSCFSKAAAAFSQECRRTFSPGSVAKFCVIRKQG